MGPCHLRLFGAPELRPADGAAPAVTLASKELALLGHLAIERGARSRESLATLLWGDAPDEQARASLRQALVSLRSALGPALAVTRHTVALIEDRIGCDAREFLHAADAGAASAATYPVGQFLEGLPLRRAEPFEEWLAATRLDLRRRQERVFERVARSAMEGWRWREAADWADRWLGAWPDSAPAAYMLVEALYLAGDRAAALARAEEFQRARQGTPTPLLAELVEQIRRAPGGAPPRPITREWSATPAGREPALVGRQEAWDALVRGWSRATRGVGSVTLVAGVPGAGRTRLVQDLARWVATQGGSVLAGAAREAVESIPYAAIAAALRGMLGAPGLAGAPPEALAEVARLVPELRQRFGRLPATPHYDDGTDRLRLAEGVVATLGALAAERPVLLTLDDVDSADAPSRDLVRHLAPRLATTGVAVVLAGRPGTEEALRLPMLRLVPIGPLADGELRALTADLLEVGPDDPAVEALLSRVPADGAALPGTVTATVRAQQAATRMPAVGA